MKDLYQELIKYYEYLAGGEIPNKDSFIKALKLTATPEELRLFFLMPLHDSMPEKDLIPKAAAIGIEKDKLDTLLNHMVKEAIVLRYTTEEGPAYERSHVVFMTEQQVRRKEDSEKKRIYAEFFDNIIEDDRSTASTAQTTPWFRAIPVESTVTKEPSIGKYEVHMPVADPRTVLPLDIVSEMVKAQPLIAVADCYCRAARKAVGKDCGHLMETCFCFNDFAEALIDCGTARKLELDEALDILQKCEENGLIHFIDNAEGKIRGLCNCCSCSCIMLKAIEHGAVASGTPSRFIISYDNQKCTHCGVCAQVCQVSALDFSGSQLTVNSNKCFGCGLCISRCPEGALKLVPRDSYAKIYKTKHELNNQIFSELKK